MYALHTETEKPNVLKVDVIHYSRNMVKYYIQKYMHMCIKDF